YGELLDFALVVVPDKDLGVVADIVISAYRPLSVVLREDLGLHVVEASGRIRIRVRRGKQLHQGLHIRVNASCLTSACTGGDRCTPKSRYCSSIELSRGFAGSGNGPLLRHFGGREVAGEFACRRHRRPEQSGIKSLFVIFEAGEEKQLLAALVEVCSGDNHRTAEGTARVIVGIRGLLYSTRVIQPVVRVERMVSCREERAAVEIPAAGLRTGVVRMGPFWFSALKLDVRTLNSWTKSELGLTGVSQLHPGSETCAPSAVMSKLFVGRPL